MKYNSVYEIGVGDVVIMTDKDGYKTDHLVLVNYIIGQTDKTGYTPNKNRTILIDSEGRKTVVNDFTQMDHVA